ncbi:hypothetical protein DV515_00009273 [Chloebia gouldiae]|uniref:Uncharacterized protein n=1 Tax=Chloebia gouldiae TaxID=44316 RepID=A0A3L8SDL1_CHLGU|nr:hypothetical protein DV515_00009273 [Chloebia gouldiae]
MAAAAAPRTGLTGGHGRTSQLVLFCKSEARREEAKAGKQLFFEEKDFTTLPLFSPSGAMTGKIEFYIHVVGKHDICTLACHTASGPSTVLHETSLDIPQSVSMQNNPIM